MKHIRLSAGFLDPLCSLMGLFFLGCLSASAQRTMVVGCWNVENLFDCRHDTLKNDHDFLPEGAYRWTNARYWKKLNDVSQTIVAMGGEAGLPVVVGLCEVENDTVMRDLTKRSALRTAGYEYVMTESDDARGVDVALLYQPLAFRLLEWHSVRVPSREHGMMPTRDMLYAKGMIPVGDTLHLVVCHLPSKAGGARQASQHRKLAAATLRGVVDSVLAISPDAKMLVMGDFNASWGERVFKPLCPPLYETLPTSRKELLLPVGTYYFQRQWSYLDHILVTNGMLAWQREVSNDLSSTITAHEVKLPFLLNKEGTPHRTYKGSYYNGGVSDHLPLLIELKTR